MWKRWIRPELNVLSLKFVAVGTAFVLTHAEETADSSTSPSTRCARSGFGRNDEFVNCLEAGHKRVSGIRRKPERVPLGPSLFANSGWRAWLSETGMYENPLVPNAKLRQMYVAMAEARALDEHVAGLQTRIKNLKGRRRLDSIRRQEACRVSTAIDLEPGDLVSDSQAGVVMDLLAGAKVNSLLKRVAELHSGKKTKGAKVDG